MTPMTDQECLLAVLAEFGYDSAKVEVHATPVALVGYAGNRGGQTANVVIRKQHLGGALNDVGFLATSTGYKAFVSDDHPRYGTAWLSQINSRYQTHWVAKRKRMVAEEQRRMEEDRRRLVEEQRHAIHERARNMGYQVKETREGETIRMVLVRRTY